MLEHSAALITAAAVVTLNSGSTRSFTEVAGKSLSIRMEARMFIAKVSEISATSAKSFEDAVVEGLARANKTLPQRAQRVDQGAAGAGA